MVASESLFANKLCFQTRGCAPEKNPLNWFDMLLILVSLCVLFTMVL